MLNNKNKKEVQFEQPSDFLIMVNRYIIIIMAFIILVILAAGYWFLLKPKIEGISSIEIESTETEERRLKNELLLTKLKELEAEYEDIMNNRQEDLDSLKSMVPKGSQVAELFVIADRLADEHEFQLMNIDISDSTPSREESDDAIGFEEAQLVAGQESEQVDMESVDSILASTGIKAMIVHLTIAKTVGEDDETTGKEVYDAFKNYVSEVENNIRLLDIQAITFGEIMPEGPEDYLFNLDLITYYQ